MTRHLNVRVTPQADTNAVEDAGDGILKVMTTKPAADGAANEAVIKLVRDYLGTDVSVRIVSGHKQTNKILAIADN